MNDGSSTNKTDEKTDMSDGQEMKILEGKLKVISSVWVFSGGFSIELCLFVCVFLYTLYIPDNDYD